MGPIPAELDAGGPLAKNSTPRAATPRGEVDRVFSSETAIFGGVTTRSGVSRVLRGCARVEKRWISMFLGAARDRRRCGARPTDAMVDQFFVYSIGVSYKRSVFRRDLGYL